MLTVLYLVLVGVEPGDVDRHNLGERVRGRQRLAIQRKNEQAPSSITVRHAQSTGFTHGALDCRISAPTHEDSNVLYAVDLIGNGRCGNRASAIVVPQLIARAGVIGSKI